MKKETSTRVYEFATGHKLLPTSNSKKGLLKAEVQNLPHARRAGKEIFWKIALSGEIWKNCHTEGETLFSS